MLMINSKQFANVDWVSYAIFRKRSPCQPAYFRSWRNGQWKVSLTKYMKPKRIKPGKFIVWAMDKTSPVHSPHRFLNTILIQCEFIKIQTQLHITTKSNGKGTRALTYKLALMHPNHMYQQAISKYVRQGIISVTLLYSTQLNSTQLNSHAHTNPSNTH